MVVPKTGALVLLALFVAVVLIEQLIGFFVGRSTNNLLALALLIVGAGVAGWSARHVGLGMPAKAPDTQGAD